MKFAYDFPQIKNIDDVAPHIRNKKEIVTAVKDWYTVINYVVVTEKTFPNVNSLGDAIVRECRGLIFDTETGKLLSRPYHKFFNLGERFETLPSNVDVSDWHTLLDKLDGSMVRPILDPNGEYRLATKMGITDTSIEAEKFLKKDSKYYDFFAACDRRGITPIFEWLSVDNPIVVRYSEPQLVLTAMRDIQFGGYFTYEDIKSSANKAGIPVVKASGSIGDIDQFVKKATSERGIEGYIIRFDNGQMVKIKTEEYVHMHKSKEIVLNPRRIIKLILEEKIDDVKPSLIKADLDKVIHFETQTSYVLYEIKDKLDAYFKKYGRMDRKNYAQNVAPKLLPLYRTGVFSMMDGKDSLDIVKKFMLDAAGQDKSFGVFRDEYDVFKEKQNGEEVRSDEQL